MFEDRFPANEDPVERGTAIAKQMLDVQVQPPVALAEEHETDHLAVTEGPPTVTQEYDRSGATPFVLKLTQSDRPAFTSVMEKISLPNMIRAIGPLAHLYEKRGGTFSEPERRIIELLATLSTMRVIVVENCVISIRNFDGYRQAQILQ